MEASIWKVLTQEELALALGPVPTLRWPHLASESVLGSTPLRRLPHPIVLGRRRSLAHKRDDQQEAGEQRSPGVGLQLLRKAGRRDLGPLVRWHLVPSYQDNRRCPLCRPSRGTGRGSPRTVL